METGKVENAKDETKAAYRPIPVAIAGIIGTDFDKSVVVIVACDDTFQKIHFTTYGDSAANKVRATNLGDEIARRIGVDWAQLETFQDFRRNAFTDLVAAERTRQMAGEKTSGVEFEDNCKRGELAIAAAYCALPDGARHPNWPWPHPTGWDARTNFATNEDRLVAAGAYLAAEYDRLQRVKALGNLTGVRKPTAEEKAGQTSGLSHGVGSAGPKLATEDELNPEDQQGGGSVG